MRSLLFDNRTKSSRFAKLSLPVESELGRCSMSVREVLSLAPGSLIRLPAPWGRQWTCT